MNISNETLFCVGIIVSFLGILIMIFDYPQIQFLENADMDPQILLDNETRDIYQRLLVEFFIGLAILVSGTLVIASSFLKGFKNRVR